MSSHLARPTEVRPITTVILAAWLMCIKQIVEYSRPTSAYPSYPQPLLYEHIRTMIFPLEWEIPWDKIHSRYEVTLKCLGPFGAELYLYLEMRQRVVTLFALVQQADAETFLMNFAGWDLEMMQEATATAPPSELINLDGILSKYQVLFGDWEHAIDVLEDWCTPQVSELVKILKHYYTESFQGIVFVEQRHVAVSLARILNRTAELRGRIKCGELVGHGGTANKVQIKGMATQNQQEIVRKFRDREINLCEWLQL
jgi:endoribonuclease Dicer